MLEGAPRVVEGGHTGSLDRVVAPRPAVARLGPFTEVRSDQPFPLEPIERRVDGAGGNRPVQALLDCCMNAAPVRLVSEADDREKDGLFECSEHVSHFAYNVDELNDARKSYDFDFSDRSMRASSMRSFSSAFS
jgi:hypothetical protein